MKQAHLSVILGASVAALAVVALHREFGGRSGSIPPPPPPTYEPDWRMAADSGMSEDSGARALTLVEFIDFQCPGCRALHEDMKNVKEDLGDNLRIVYVHLPMSYHEYAVPAARASVCAAAQGVLSEFVDVAFAKQDSFGLKSWPSYLLEAGVTSIDFANECMTDSATSHSVEAGRAAARALAVGSTPTVLLNGWRFPYPPRARTLLSTAERLLRGELPEGAGTEQTTGATPAEARVVDGVRKLVYEANAFEDIAAYEVDDTAQLRWGGFDAPPEFDITGFADMHLRSDSVAVVSLPFDQRFLKFSPDGTGRQIVGSMGRGPGQFMRFGRTALKHDTLFVLDAGNHRITWFVDELVGDRALPTSFPSDVTDLVGFLPNGLLVASTQTPLMPVQGDSIVRIPTRVAVLDTSLALRFVASIPGLSVKSVRTNYRGREGRRPMPLLFSPGASVVVFGNRIVSSDGSTYSLHFHDAAGSVQLILEAHLPARSVSEDMRRAESERLYTEMIARMSEPLIDPQETRRQFQEMPFASVLPAIGDLLVSQDSLLWVVEYHLNSDEHWFATAFDSSGSLIRRVRGSGDLPPVYFGSNFVLVHARDADGLEWLEKRGWHPTSDG